MCMCEYSRNQTRQCQEIVQKWPDLRDEDGLVLAADHHALEGSLGDGEDVGRHLVAPLPNVDLHGALGVDGETLVGVDGNTEETGVGVDEFILVPDN